MPAAALTMLRSSYYAPGYAAKENPAYLPMAVNSLILFFSDLCGFLCRKKRAYVLC